MIKYAIALVAVASVCSAIPAQAEEVGSGVGPRGVTVGESHDRDRDRDRERFRDRDHRDRGETVIIRKDRDRDRRPIVIDRD
jgi:Ni/Co efflux regulator RcnB